MSDYRKRKRNAIKKMEGRNMIPSELKEGEAYYLPLVASKPANCDNPECPCSGWILIPIVSDPENQLRPHTVFHVRKDGVISMSIEDGRGGSGMPDTAAHIEQLQPE